MESQGVWFKVKCISNIKIKVIIFALETKIVDLLVDVVTLCRQEFSLIFSYCETLSLVINPNLLELDVYLGLKRDLWH
jgi:hypothetical protein